MYVRENSNMRWRKILYSLKNTVEGTDAECEDEKLQECYYRHELPKAGYVFQPVGNVPLWFAARGVAFYSLNLFYFLCQNAM